MLHNKKKAVHNIAVYCKERYAEKSVKRNHVVRFLRKRISEFKLKEAKSSPRHGARILLRKTRRIRMRINGFSGTNTQTGTMGMTQGNDSVSKNIQNQIANAQQKLQDLSSNEEMSLEDKMKKRQEIQQEINNLNQQLRQHQIEQRKEQQSKNSSSMDDMVAGTSNTSKKKDTGLSQASMQAMISADSSMKQAKVQGSMATQIQGRASVLESEIKQDAGKGNTEKKEEELAELQAKAQSATAAQMSTLADANKSVEEAAKAENSNTEDTATKNNTDKSEKTQESAGAAAEETDSVKNTDIKGETQVTVKPKVEEPIGYELTIQDTNEVEWEHYTSMREYSGLTLKDGKYNLEDVMKSMMDVYETRYNYIVKEHENGERRISYDLTGENSLTLDEDLAGLDRAYNKRLANLAGYIVCQQTNDGSKFFQTTNVKKNTAEQKEYIDTAVSMMEKAQKRFLEMREEPKYTAGIAKSVIGDIMSSDKNFMETTQRLFAKTIYHNAKKNIF